MTLVRKAVKITDLVKMSGEEELQTDRLES